MCRTFYRLLVCLAVGVGGYDAPAQAEAQTFGRAQLCLALSPRPFTVEVAATEVQRQSGLMGRESLAAGTGMWFQYSNELIPKHGFWMYGVPFPLDIAFISAAGRIVSITTMEPCLAADPKACPAYYSEKPFKSALEVNAGFFAEAGIGVGDKVWGATNGKCMPE